MNQMFDKNIEDKNKEIECHPKRIENQKLDARANEEKHTKQKKRTWKKEKSSYLAELRLKELKIKNINAEIELA